MQIGIVGLGRMGLGLARRLVAAGHEVAATDLDTAAREAAAAAGVATVESARELPTRLEAPRILWLMVPAGSTVDEVIAAAEPALDRDDLVVDGGNSFYRDSIRRAELSGLAHRTGGRPGAVTNRRFRRRLRCRRRSAESSRERRTRWSPRRAPRPR